MSRAPHAPALAILLPCVLLLSGPGGACEPDHPDRPRLVGQWTWIYTIDEHESYTPEDVGYTMDLHLEANGDFERYHGDDLVEAGTWCLRECTFEPLFAHCAGQTILSLGTCAMDGNPWCEREYRFCEEGQCVPLPFPAEDAIQLRLLDHHDEAVVYVPSSTVAGRDTSWSALKARH